MVIKDLPIFSVIIKKEPESSSDGMLTDTVNVTYKDSYPYASIFSFPVFCVSLVNIVLNTFNINSRFISVTHVIIWGQESEAGSQKKSAGH